MKHIIILFAQHKYLKAHQGILQTYDGIIYVTHTHMMLTLNYNESKKCELRICMCCISSPDDLQKIVHNYFKCTIKWFKICQDTSCVAKCSKPQMLLTFMILYHVRYPIYKTSYHEVLYIVCSI